MSCLQVTDICMAEIGGICKSLIVLKDSKIESLSICDKGGPEE